MLTAATISLFLIVIEFKLSSQFSGDFVFESPQKRTADDAAK
jgi:hypothetical protein